MRISRKGNKCCAFRSGAKESQATLYTEKTERRTHMSEKSILWRVIHYMNPKRTDAKMVKLWIQKIHNLTIFASVRLGFI